jgi:DNA-binding HxlR family transcriptional regulator
MGYLKMIQQSSKEQVALVDPKETAATQQMLESEARKVCGRKAVDLKKALKRIADERTEKISNSLMRLGPMTFGSLLKETGLSSSQLNHTIEEMKKNELLIRNEESGKYHLTLFCVILIGGIEYVKDGLSKIPEDKILGIYSGKSNAEQI